MSDSYKLLIKTSHQTYESMCSPLESGDLPAVHVNPEASFDPVRDVILDLREQVEELCNQELGKITKQGLPLKSLSSFCHFSCCSYSYLLFSSQ